MKKKSGFFNGDPRTGIIIAMVLLGVLFILHQLTEYTRSVKTLSHPAFIEKIEKGEVRRVHFVGQDGVGRLKDGTRFETTVAKEDPRIWQELREYNVDFTVDSPAQHVSWWYIIPLISIIGMMAALWYFLRQSRNNMGGGTGNIFSVGKSRARMVSPASIKENFESVAGADGAKEELKDVVDYLRNPTKYERLGAKMTRGVLLVGAPGNGKTLLARAVAGEAHCPFFSVSGSDFIEVFVGVGAARVRDLFKKAREHAPAIIFIDEIDAIGGRRGHGMGGGHDEREQTLNQLLTEMDGFSTHDSSVVVIAATNRPDVLDEALLRPGRFDRRVQVPYPDLVSREKILTVHARAIKISNDVDLKRFARATPGFSGADLANLVNEAAIHASKLNKDLVDVEDFYTAKDKIVMGKENKTLLLTEDERSLTAYHEAGHALVAIIEPDHADPVDQITIIPRHSGALGFTAFLPQRDQAIRSKEQLLAYIMRACGGRAAEELIFNKRTTGPCDDFKNASDIARSMVCYYGMAPEIGHVFYDPSAQGRYKYSPTTARKIDGAVDRIVQECYTRTIDILKSNREKLDMLARALLEKETLYADEIYAMFGRSQHSKAGNDSQTNQDDGDIEPSVAAHQSA